ncbi:CoxG family protein [Paracandidimonas soli]|uniref:CoxG family protein n=1 Tax=Paracandidimonas soli TaxID=1917182 RepID=UPI0033412C6E
MLVEGSKILAASRGEVWKALNDPDFLRRSIPGCREVKVVSPGELEVGLTVSVGPIKANFDTQLQIRDVRELESYVLAGSGSAGAAGSGSGTVRVSLSDVPGGTKLDYSAETEVSGRVAQLGARMMDSTARRFAEQFFANISRLLGGEEMPAAQALETRRAARASVASGEGAAQPQAWAGALAWKLALGCGVGAFLGNVLAAWVARL